jgi:hypothetical protein
VEIKASKFVKRQTKDSEFSYFSGSWEELEYMTGLYFISYSKFGYRDGVLLVNIPVVDNFYSAVVPITEEIEFETIFESRREGEQSFKKSIAYGKKSPANRVDIVLYHKDVLEEDETDKESLTGADWEIVSINCSPYEYEIPMTPIAKARNILACTDHPFGKGGSCDTNSTAVELAECVAFWATHTMIRERCI